MKPLVVLVTWNHFLRESSWYACGSGKTLECEVHQFFGFVLSLAPSLEKKTTHTLFTSNHEKVASLRTSKKGICWEDHQLQRLRQMPEKIKHTTVRSTTLVLTLLISVEKQNYRWTVHWYHYNIVHTLRE